MPLGEDSVLRVFCSSSFVLGGRQECIAFEMYPNKIHLVAMALLTVVLLSSLSVCSAAVEENVTVKWSTVDQLIQKMFSHLPRPDIFQLYRLSKSLSVSSQCEASLLQAAVGLKKTKEWIVHMVDASGKLPSGILDGTVMDFGSFEECLKIRVNDSSKELFRGRYCMVGYSSPLISPLVPDSSTGRNYIDNYGYPPKWIADEIIKAGGYLKRVAFWLGTCVPSTCSERDLTNILSYVTKPLGFKVSIADCQVDETKQWPLFVKVSVCILSLFGGLCTIGTIVDITLRLKFYRSNYSILHLLKIFSFLTNTEKLFCIASESGKLDCFHGIRFFSATWIILGHAYFFTDTWKYLKYRNLLGLQELFNRHWPLAVIENFTIPVGSFFFMSGFLLVYSTWKKLEIRNGRLNLLLFFLHKYWRMTPPLALMILMFMMMPLINSGPLWQSTLDPPIEACQKNWWTNMLYINNWWNSDEFCIIHTWYLAALMQLHLVGVVVLVVSYRWPIFGVLLGLLISFGSCIITSLIAAWNNFPMPAPAIIKDMDIVDDYNNKIYIKTFNHTITYFIGMLTALVFLKFKDKRLSLTCKVIGWFLAIAGSVSSVYGLYGPANSVGVRSFYIGFHRIGWTFGVAWLVYSCITNNGGMLNRFLSWKAFVPLGRLSYLVYLLHPLVILYRTASLRERAFYGHTDLVFDYLAYTMVSFFLAFVGYVTVEMPFTIVGGMLFKDTSSSLVKGPSDVKGGVADVKNVSP